MLEHIQKVVEEFVRRVCKAKGLPASTVENAGGKIFTFGSYSLGVYGPTSDIDTLVVAPKHVNMNDFFDEFPKVFYEMSKAEDIKEFHPVPEAFVPIIKMEYSNVPVDLIFVSIPHMTSIDPKNTKVTERSFIRGLGDTAMRALNGTRVTTELLDAVPQHKSFRHALRAIKIWSNSKSLSLAQRKVCLANQLQSARYTAMCMDIPAVSRGPSW